MIKNQKQFEEDVKLLLARIEEVYGHNIWFREPLTDLEKAAQKVSKHFPTTLNAKK